MNDVMDGGYHAGLQSKLDRSLEGGVLMQTVEFLRPRLCGARFDGGVIPLEVLKDLAVLEEMVVEVAKWQFLKENPDRRRSPRGFTDGIQLKLSGIEDGSAIPIITLAVASLNLPGIPQDNHLYFEKARDAIVGAIGAAERDQQIVSHIPEECLGYFDRIGRSLREGEAIEFITPSRTMTARLNRETRRKLVLASSRVKEFTDDVTLRGSIPEADQDKMTFELQLVDGHKVSSPMANQHLDTIIEAFNGYRKGMRVLLQGIGRYNRQNRLMGLESVGHISLLEPLDIPARLEELRILKDGWLDGKGMAPSHDGLDWLATAFDRNFPDSLPLPHLYPTAEGGVEAEWPLESNEVSLEIDLTTHGGAWHRLNVATGEEDVRSLNLNDEGDWAWLVTEVQRLAGGEA